MIYPWNDSDLTFIDGFCGLGGSSLGGEFAGARVKLAMNHNEHSLATHAHNFPHAAHAKVDISQIDPKAYPHATMLWMSPECTNQSTSKGIKLLGQNQPSLPGEWTDREEDPFIERSRATMWDVVRWTQAKKEQGHPFQLVFVENVTKVLLWGKYNAWLQAMLNLDYEYKTISFNSMFAPRLPCPVPQSRDRWYTVFWRKGNPAPDLDLCPEAFCHRCNQVVQAQQCFNPARSAGDYTKQYVYCCPHCVTKEVIPNFTPAHTIIDWEAKIVKVGDRRGYRVLKKTTLDRIQEGLNRFCNPFLIETCRTGRVSSKHRARSVHDAWPTQTTAQSVGLVVPNAFLISYNKNTVYRSIHGVVGTCTSKDRHALVNPPRNNTMPEVAECGFRMLSLLEVQRAMGFPDSYEIICTSQKEGVRQCGLAVTPAVATVLMQRGMASLGYQSPRKENVSRPYNTV